MLEWKQMWQVTTWDKKFSGVDKSMQPQVIKYHYYLANELAELERQDGDIRILYTTDKIAFADSADVNEYIADREVVAIPWGGNVSVKYYKGKFVTADNRIASSNDTNYLDNKFLYYWMLSQIDLIGSFYRGAGIQHPSMYKILTMRIPIPSLTTQIRIVGILDTFTTSIENLKQQISERRKQYEYYRDKLLDLESKEGVERKSLGEICTFIRGPFGGALKKEIFVESGYAIYEQQHAIYGQWDFRYYIDSKKYEQMKRFEVQSGDILMSCSGTMGKTSIIPEHHVPGIINQALLKLTVNNGVYNKYIKHFMDSRWFQEELKKNTSGGAIQNVASVSVLKELNVFLPSISEQYRIVSILDTFEESIQNLESQLKLREKQYEYYRNKLLTFE